MPFITIEVREDAFGVNHIAQARGKCNRSLNKQEQYAVDLFERTIVKKVKTAAEMEETVVEPLFALAY